MIPRSQYKTRKNAPKKGIGSHIQFRSWRKPYKTKSLVCSEDKFDNHICVKPFWIVKSDHLSSGINLVLLSTLYKFIVWAVRVWAQSGFGINIISVLIALLCLIAHFLLMAGLVAIVFCFIIEKDSKFHPASCLLQLECLRPNNNTKWLAGEIWFRTKAIHFSQYSWERFWNRFGKAVFIFFDRGQNRSKGMHSTIETC